MQTSNSNGATADPGLSFATIAINFSTLPDFSAVGRSIDGHPTYE